MKRLILLLLPVALAAADKQSLTLKQAVDLALAPDANTRIALSRLAAEQARTRVSQATAALLPNVDAGLTGMNFTRNLRAFGITFPAIPGFQPRDVVGPITNFDARATATLSVFDFSAWKRRAAAQEATQAANAEIEAARNAAAETIAHAYVSARRADAAILLSQANLRLAEALLKLAQNRKDAGAGIAVEVTRAELQLASERQRLNAAESNRRKAHFALARLLNLDMATEFDLLDPIGVPELDLPPLPQALEAARQNRPDLTAQKRREAAAKTSYEAVKFERLPSVNAFADYGAIGLDVASAIPTRTYGATLRIPLFDGGRRDARRAESALAHRAESTRTADLNRQVELDVRLALESVHAAATQLDVARQALSLSEKELSHATNRYENGVAPHLEVIDAQTRLERAQSSLLDAQAITSRSRIDLAAAMGALHRILQ